MIAIHADYAWPGDTARAIDVQQSLREKIILEDDFDVIDTLAGVDVSYDPSSNLSHAAVVLLSWPDFTLLEQATATIPTEIPYIPGFLSFREIPAIIAALNKLSITPDLLMVDGHGIAHPRRLGIAAHLGIALNLPSIGVAKKRLTGRNEEPDNIKGATMPLIHKKELIGTVLRSRVNVKPLFISPGHRISQQTAVTFVLRSLTKYRLPEPTRLADKLSKTWKKPK